MKRTFKALLFYLFVFIVLTFPLVLKFNKVILGSTGGYGDLSLDLWLQWFVFSCVKAGKSFLYSSLINYPVGLSLLDNVSGFLIPVVGCIPRFFLHQIASYNLTACLVMVFSAYAGYLLARYLTKDEAASLLAGFIFGFNPFVLNEVLYGRLIVAAGGWVALYVLFLYKVLHETKRTNVFMAMLMLLCASLTSVYYGYLLVLLTGIFMACHGAAYKPLRADWRLLGKLLIVIAGYMACIGAFYKFRFTAIDSTMVLPGSWAVFFKKEIPTQLHQIALQSLDINPVVQSEYVFPEVIKRLSLLTLALSAAGIAAYKKKPVFFIASGVFFFIMALGPLLKVSGHLVSVKNIFVPMPYLLLYGYAPFFNRIHWPDRFLIVFMLSVSVLSAYGFKWLADTLKPARFSRYIWLLLCVSLLTVEIAVTPLARIFPAATTRMPIPEFYDQLSREDGDFAIIQFPFGDTRYLYYQTIHHKKIFDSQTYLTRRHPAAYEKFISGNAFLKALQKLQDFPEIPLADIQKGDLEKLRSTGFRYIVLDSADKTLTEALIRSLDAVVGIHRAYPDGIVVFKL